MTENFFDLLKCDDIEGGSITQETRSLMSQMLDFGDSHPVAPSTQRERPQMTGVTQPPTIPPHLSTLVPPLVALVGRILHELESNLPKLLSLNPSRREAIAQHLDRLAGSSLTVQSQKFDPTTALRKWIEHPRNPAQNNALKTYLEELALIALGQAIVLKNWSDRGIRPFVESDLGRLNWALSTALKPFIPLDREGWQITRPNLYSWYNFPTFLQREIWNTLSGWRISDEGPTFLSSLLNPLRRAIPDSPEANAYDVRFMKALWEHIHLFGFQHQPEPHSVRRNKIVFSPTLRDCSIVRLGPENLNWIGLETSSFQLMMGELMQIWWGPSPPPCWSIGTGLEVHTRDQLALSLGSSKPTVINRISEIESCDAAFLFEEQVIRTQGRSPASLRYREQVESLPYFKKIRSAGTSLGTLQACVALSKLRPGGILIWTREETLNSKEGTEVLNFILDRAKLICEWDFSELEHTLPVSIPLHPKHLYLFQKETDLESRLAHRPVRHVIQGQLRSHVELGLLLEDTLQSQVHTVSPRGQWRILSHSSPTSQRDWIENWPEPPSQQLVVQLDQLREASLPLANFTTIRPTPEGDTKRNGAWTIAPNYKGFWLVAENTPDGRKLVAKALPKHGQEVTGSGLLVLVSDETWIASLMAYMGSPVVQKWLDQHAERKGEKWILNEQVVRWIPIPKCLLDALEIPHSESMTSFRLPLNWESLAEEILYQPKMVKEELEKLEMDSDFYRIHSKIFVRAATAVDQLCSGQNKLFSLVTSDGRIKWRELINILPKSECVSISIHPKIRLSGSLPPHLPIGKIERVRSPKAGILFSTESGFTLHLSAEGTLLSTIVWEQLEGLSHPTWSELIQYLKVPRRIEIAESTALDVLRSHSEQSIRLNELKELLASCQLF